MKRLTYPLVALATLAALTLTACEKSPNKETPQPVRVESVTVAPKTLTLEVDQTATLTATVLPANADNPTVTWTSDKPAIATVNPSTGEVKTIAPGTATITATADGKTGQCVVTVNPKPVPVEGVTVEPKTLTLEVDQTATLAATVLPENADNPTVSWSSDKPAIASVDPATGEVKAIAEGEATITATADGKTGQCVVTVNPKPVPVESVTVAPATLMLEVDQTTTLAATVLPENADHPTVTWTSDKPAIATVDPATGEVKAIAEGTAIITATADGITGQCAVTVTPNEDVLELIPDAAFRAYCEAQMEYWDTDKNGKLSFTEAARVADIDCRDLGIVSLEGIEYFSGLTYLVCDFNMLSFVDVSDCPDLSVLSLIGNDLMVLDVSKNTALTSLDCRQNRLSSIDLSKNTALKELDCTWNQLTGLDISKNTALTQLLCWDNPGDGVSKFPVKVWFEGQTPPFEMRSPTWQSNGKTITIEYTTGELPTPPTNDYYTSTDYSRDGRVTQLQKATKGAGIDIVLMGDGYSDRLIANGTYAATMNFAWESLFTEEPYKSLKNMFNVYMVDVVSKNEIFADDSFTALNVVMSATTTETNGDDATVFRYGRKAITTDTRMNNAVIVVMVNSTSWHGTCWMYYPEQSNDHGDGTTVSYFSRGQNDGELRMLLHHEVNGHGFVKLGDEYWYDDNAVATEDVITERREQATWGWNRNIDFTGDPKKVKWAKYLTDSRYAGQGLGVYEGAYYYGKGIWRPTNLSIMRYNYGGFNAPSREAIYYRAHKLAYGASWQYDHEEFVAWDLAHYTAPARTAQAPGFGVLRPRPHTPPVVVPHSWREVMGK